MPQIEVTFDLDANGILTVSAAENATGKKSNIKINNDKGRLTKEQIQTMIEEAEKFKETDMEVKAAVAAKNDLESYLYQINSLFQDPMVSSRVGEADRMKILKLCGEITNWINSKDIYSEQEYALKRQDLENMCKPAIMNIYGSRGPNQTERQFPSPDNGGPTIEEVD